MLMFLFSRHRSNRAHTCQLTILAIDEFSFLNFLLNLLSSNSSCSKFCRSGSKYLKQVKSGNYRKHPKNSDTWKIAVIILKFE